MKTWTVRQRILASFGLIVLLMAVMGAIVFVNMRAIGEETGHLSSDAIPGLYYIAEIQRAASARFAAVEEAVNEQNAGDRNALLAGMREAEAQLAGAMRNYQGSVFQARDRELFEVVRSAVASYASAEAELLKTDGGARAAAVRRLRSEFDRLKAAIKVGIDYNKQNADSHVQDITRAISAARMGIFASFAATLAAAIVAGILLLRAITQPLHQLVAAAEVMSRGDFTQRIAVERADEFGALAGGFGRMSRELAGLVTDVQKSGVVVATSITEIGATAKEQQATANEVAATTTEIGATAKEISATARDLAQTVAHVSESAQQTATLADSGRESLERMDETMRRVSDAAGGINSRLTVLNDKAANIGSVVTTIAKVADQTNLLSLNAAIEAEKAGEYGRGFAVVATEIRRLADQTASATVDIEQLVKEIQSAVTAGVMGMDKFSEEVRRGVSEVEKVAGQLAQIIQHVQTITPRIQSVSEGMQAQSTGAEQISQSLAQLSDAARQTAESLRQSNEIVRALDEAARGLRSGIDRFKVQP